MFKLFQLNDLTNFLARFARSYFIKINLLYLVRQVDNFLAFIFASAKVILIGVFIVIIMLILIENWLIRLSDRSYFSIFFLALLFLENGLLHEYLLFHSKLAFTQYKYRIFSSLARILKNKCYIFFHTADRWKILFSVLLVLLSQLLIVMILYLEKPYYRYFFIQIIPAFNITTFSKFLSVLFCVRAFDSLIYYSFLWILYLSLLFYIQNHSFIPHVFFS